MKLIASLVALLGSGRPGVAVATTVPLAFTQEAAWLGSFDEFNFDALLAQSNSPVAQELLGLQDALPDGNDQEIQLSQRGWFDDSYTREQRRKKKLKQVLKMVFFLQADNSVAALEKYLFYGCYCFPDGHNKLFGGYGEPIDEVDRVCKAFQTCYRCVGIDFGQEECINAKGYEFQGLYEEDTGFKEIVCKNNGRGEGSRCSRAQCECDKQLALQLAEMEITWNPTYQAGKYGLFDRHTTCAASEERSQVENHAIDVKCCGYYPKRTPYAYNGPNGIRNCCGSKTYDPNILECCPGDELHQLGTCMY